MSSAALAPRSAAHPGAHGQEEGVTEVARNRMEVGVILLERARTYAFLRRSCVVIVSRKVRDCTAGPGVVGRGEVHVLTATHQGRF